MCALELEMTVHIPSVLKVVPLLFLKVGTPSIQTGKQDPDS